MNYLQCFKNINIATMQDGQYHFLQKAALVIEDEKIAWVGYEKDLPKHYLEKDVIYYDGQGLCALPGLIDAHTHSIYAGNRANEFAMRLQGKTYTDIAKAGGGIISTVSATRNATENELFTQAKRRLMIMREQGVTTVEIKSGYGLDEITEINCLQIAKKLSQSLDMNIKRTYLGAHALPPEFVDKDTYIDWMIAVMLPKIAKQSLADFVDVYCESIAFNLTQTKRYLESAKSLGFKLKMHAEQLTDMGASLLASELGATSVDHLEYLNQNTCAALAKSKTTAVLLPGAFYFLREKQIPPIKALCDAGVNIAIASDSNPGTSPTTSLLLVANMAAVFFGLEAERCLAGITIFAAHALAIEKTHGSLEVGKMADIAFFAVEHPQELIYWLQENRCQSVVVAGKVDESFFTK